MRNLWISLLIVICFASINSQLTGTWNIGWQTNLHQDQCVPDSFTIYQNTTDVFYVNYTYNYQVQAACQITPEQLSTNLSSVGSNLYNDTLGRGMTFVDNSFILLAINGSTNSFFYQKSTDPSVIPQALTLGTLGSFWNTQINPKLGCCAPDSILIIPSGPAPTSGLNYSTYYISTTCAQNLTNGKLTPFNSNITSVKWVDSTTSPTIGLMFTPSTSWLAMIVTFGTGKSSCSYTYQRANATGPSLNNNWRQDWQTANDPVFPSVYQINTVTPGDGNVTYMMSQYADSMKVMSGFVVQSAKTQYTDSALGRTFQYDPKTGSLMSGNFLYTLNGSLLSPAPYIQYWGAPQVLGDLTDCCYPASINISAHPNNNKSLDVVYTMPDNYTAISGCDDFIHDINDNGAIESTLVIGTPSFTRLVWNDTKLIGTQIYFSNASIPSEITSSFPGQCGFRMIVTKPPGPKPKPGPLFGSSIPMKAMGLIIGLFIVLACM